MQQNHVQSRGSAIWWSTVIAPIITGVFVLLRVYSKVFLTKKLQLNDWICFATIPFLIGFSVTIAEATKNGMGRHNDEFTAKLSEHYYFWIMISSEFYVLSLAGYKSALLTLYIALFGINRKFRYLCYAVLFYTNGYLLSNLLTEVAGCHPIQKFYKPDVPGHCIDYTQADIAYGAGYITTDLAIAIMPLPLIWRLQLRSRKEKIGLSLVLGTGAIAFIVAVVRWVYAIVDLTTQDDYTAGMTFLLAVWEVNTGIWCGCVPSFKPLWRDISKNSQAAYSRRKSAYLSVSEASRKGSIAPIKAFIRPGKASTVSKSSISKPSLTPYTDSQPSSGHASSGKSMEKPDMPPLQWPLSNKAPGVSSLEDHVQYDYTITQAQHAHPRHMSHSQGPLNEADVSTETMKRTSAPRIPSEVLPHQTPLASPGGLVSHPVQEESLHDVDLEKGTQDHDHDHDLDNDFI